MSWLPAALCALAAVTLVFARAIGLGNSLASDEAQSAVWWIGPGPKGIFSSALYVPGNHLLYNLLTWSTLQVTGLGHVDFAYRIWSILPAVAAVAALAWWAWRRLDPWTAAAFLVLAGGSALYLYFGSDRGYGFGFLGAALMVIGAEQLLRWQPIEGLDARVPRIRTSAAVLVVGAIVGMWNLPNFVTVFVLLAAVLFTVRVLRRLVIVLVIAVGAATLAFYAPVLSAVIANANQKFGRQLPWSGFLVHPLTDLVTPNVMIFFPSMSQTTAAIVVAGLLAIGALTLALRSEGYLALVLLVPVFGSYLILEIARTYVADRFESFLLLPLLMVVAVALVGLGRLIARGGRFAGVGVAVLGVVLALFALDKNIKLADATYSIPFENYREASQVAVGAGLIPIVMLTPQSLYPQNEYYFGHRVSSEKEAELEAMFCTRSDQFVYVEFDSPETPPPNTSCLAARGAIHIPIEQRHFPVTVWIAPRTHERIHASP